MLAICVDMAPLKNGGIKVQYMIRDPYSREDVGQLDGHILGGMFFVDDFISNGAWSLGVRAVREIIRQLDFDHGPLAGLRGVRLTGMRMKAGRPTTGYAKIHPDIISDHK